MNSWDEDYLEAAFWWANRRSKDPSTKVGAIIVRPDKTEASKGFNGFPRGVDDAPERYADRGFKYPAVVHAELNALLTAREPLKGYTLYCTLMPCSTCAGAIIQAGIKRVVVPDESWPERWAESLQFSADRFAEAGVELVKIRRSM